MVLIIAMEAQTTSGASTGFIQGRAFVLFPFSIALIRYTALGRAMG